MKKHPLFFPALLCLIFPLCLSGQINSTLIQHIEKSEFQKIDSLLQTGINLHATDENGANALMWACYLSNAEMVIHLFEKGAQAPQNGGIYTSKKRDQWYGDLLAVSAGQGKTDITRYLLEKQKWPVDAQPLHPDIDSLSSWTALMHAAKNFNLKIIKIFFEAVADATLKNQDGKQAYQLTNDKALKKILQSPDIQELEKLTEQQVLGNKSIIFFNSGNYTEALKLGKKVLQLTEELYGLNHQHYGTWIGNIAAFYNGIGYFDEALPGYNQAIAHFEKHNGVNHQFVGNQLANRAKYYKDLERYDKAITDYQRALNIGERYKTTFRRSYVIRLNGLGFCYKAIGRIDEALVLHNKALRFIEQEEEEKDLGDYSETLTLLSSCYHDLGHLDKAIELGMKGLEITEIKYGKAHNNYGFRQGKIASMYLDQKEYKQALQLFQESLSNIEESLGMNHRLYGDAQLDLAITYQYLNQYPASYNAYVKVIENICRIIENHFPFVSESNKLSWRKRFAYRQDLMNSFLYTSNSEISSTVIDYNILLKGLTIRENKLFSSNDLNEKHERWLNLKKWIGQELSFPLAWQNPVLKDWIKEADELETLLASESKNFANQKKVVSSEDLRAQLKPDEAIIDFVHFNYYDVDRKTDSVIYVAYLIRPETNNMELIPLFEEKVLMALVDSSISQQEMVETLYASRGAVKGGRKNPENLSALIWKPILPYLKPYKKLYISPSGLLHKFNLGAISTEKGDLIMDRFQVFQFNSLKSMEDNYERVNVKSYLLVGDVNYDYETELDMETIVLTPRGSAETDFLELRSVTADSWQQLNGTQKEILAIEDILKTKNTFETITLKGSYATEENIKAKLSGATSPGCIHFSTHGFFFPDAGFDTDKSIAFKASDNPMIRSGIILAGANYAWQNGEIPPGKEDDGILTAYEVANLNLSNTELVVLSACETGLGDIQGSEGVFGLQRAFKIAGTRYILMSLWQVPDEATQKLMTLFYKNWLNGIEVHEALKNAQDKLRSRKSYDHPYFWSGFVLIE